MSILFWIVFATVLTIAFGASISQNENKDFVSQSGVNVDVQKEPVAATIRLKRGITIPGKRHTPFVHSFKIKFIVAQCNLNQ